MSYRFLLTPRWIAFHVLVIAAMVLMVNLSLWQWSRLSERKEFNELVEARADSAPVRLDDIVPVGADPAVADSVEWRNAQAEGEYLAQQWLVVNRSQDGAAGSNVVTAMRLDDGRVLLVNRGFVPLGEDVPPAPAGAVRVLGRVRPSAVHRLGQLSMSDGASDSGEREIPRIDIPALAEELAAGGVEGEVAPVSLEALVSEPEDSDGIDPVAAPELSEGSHLSYAIQWLIFTACVAAGWVIAVRRSLRTRRLAAAAADRTSDGDTALWVDPAPDHPVAAAAEEPAEVDVSAGAPPARPSGGTG